MRDHLPCRILIGPLGPSLELSDGRRTSSSLTHDLCLGEYRQHPQLRAFYLDPQILLQTGQQASPLPAGTLTLGRPTPDQPEDWSLAGLWRQLGDWEPEVLIWWGFHYALPADLEEAPCPTLLVVSDWHYHYTAVREYLQAFDLILCDQKLLQGLQAQGNTRAFYWPAYGFDPGMMQVEATAEREIDICFLGNTNPATYPVRNRLLRQLAGLGKDYRILIRHQVPHPDYARLLSHSKIVFNHALRQEMNLRSYEATACGALLLCERDNLEVPRILPGEGPQQACVLYDEHTLVERVRYYLEHADEREAIARRGQQTIQDHSYERQFERLLDQLPTWLARARPTARVNMPEPWHSLRAARQGITTDVPRLRVRALEQLTRLSTRQAWPDDTQLTWRNALLVCQIDLASQGLGLMSEPDLQDLLTGLSRSEPISAESLNNLAWAHFLRQDWPALAHTLAALEQLLQSQPTVHPEGFYLPLRLTPLHRLRQALMQRLEIVPAQLQAELLRLLHWSCAYLQGQLLQTRQAWQAARDSFAAACRIAPELAESWFELGRCQLSLQQHSAAIQAFEAGLNQGVYYPGVWPLLITLLQQTGSTEQARQTLIQALVLFQDPIYAGLHPALLELRRELWGA